MFKASRKKIFIGFIFLSVFLWFQNCGQIAKDNLLSEESQSDSKSSSIDIENLKSIDFEYTKTELQDRGGGRMVEVPVSNVLKLEVTGERYILDDESKWRCLTDADTNELNQILGGAAICETKSQENQVCTMEYKSPYAILKYVSKDIRLGEQTSGCSSIDLCESYPDLLKGYLADLKTNLRPECQGY